MILAIDAGNSRVKWGWHDGHGWASVASVSLIEFAASSDHVNPFSVTHAEYRSGVANTVAEPTPAMPPPRFISIKRIARPIVALARNPGPKQPLPP